MRLWAFANANRAVARKADWSATFKGWMRREVEKRRHRNSHRNNNQERVRDALAMLDDYLERTDDTTRGHASGQTAIKWLS